MHHKGGMNMDKKTMLQIGLDLNAIGMMVCEECHEKIKDRLTHIEQLILESQKEEENDGIQN